MILEILKAYCHENIGSQSAKYESISAGRHGELTELKNCILKELSDQQDIAAKVYFRSTEAKAKRHRMKI